MITIFVIVVIAICLCFTLLSLILGLGSSLIGTIVAIIGGFMKKIANIFMKKGSKIKINGTDYTSYIKEESSNTIATDDNFNVFVNGVSVSLKSQEILIEVNGDCGDIESEGSVHVSGSSGNIVASGSAKVGGNVSGGIKASGSVHCGDVGESVSAGGSVHCGHINGNVNAGGSVVCR